MNTNPLSIARACLQAYVDKDRSAIESLLTDDFRFWSPIDNGLDRRTYMARCWPNSEAIRSFDYIYQAENGDRAFVVYEGQTATKRFRNCEVYLVRDGRLAATEVYFGWNMPHPAAAGSFIDNDGAGHT